MNVWRPVELALTYGARAAWPAVQVINRHFEGGTFQPKWAPAPLLKQRQRSKPQFGWPRRTDCFVSRPGCRPTPKPWS